MSQKTKSILLRSTWLVLPLLVILGVVQGAMRSSTDTREVVLVAENMAFHRPDDPTPNPVIEAVPGETLRLVLINRDEGFRHDLQIPELGAETPFLDGDGSRAEIVIEIPDEPGDHEYECSLHARMMRGVLRVRPGSDAFYSPPGAGDTRTSSGSSTTHGALHSR